MRVRSIRPCMDLPPVDGIGGHRLGAGCEADDHAALGRAGDDADHDIVEGEADRLFLFVHLFGETDIAEPAERVHRGAERAFRGLRAGGRAAEGGAGLHPSSRGISTIC